MRTFNRNERCVSQPSLDTEESCFSKNFFLFRKKNIFNFITLGSKSMILLTLGIE